MNIVPELHPLFAQVVLPSPHAWHNNGLEHDYCARVPPPGLHKYTFANEYFSLRMAQAGQQ